MSDPGGGGGTNPDAALLSQAAAQMRADAARCGDGPDDFIPAIAAWIDTAAADLWAHGPLCCAEGCMDCDDDLWAPHVRRALAASRAYLAGRYEHHQEDQ